jgi:hypothetical protein
MHPAVREFLADVQSDVANFNVRRFVTCCERTLSHHRGTPDVQQSSQSPETSTPSGISFTASRYIRLLSGNAVDFFTTALTLRLLMSYIYGSPILDVSRSHTTTQHSR